MWPKIRLDDRARRRETRNRRMTAAPRPERLEDRFCLTKFSLTQLPPLPGNTSGLAVGLNNTSPAQVVGDSYSAGGDSHAVLWVKNGGTFVPQNLGALGGGGETIASAVNSHGQVVGRSDTGQIGLDGNPIQHAFLWQNGVLTDIDTLSNQTSEALAINDSSEVVGDYYRDGVQHAFVWENGVTYDLNSLLPPNSGWVVGTANGVNATRIAGLGFFQGQEHAYQISDPDGDFGNGVAAIADLGPAIVVNGMSPDGSRVVGQSASSAAFHATLWQKNAQGTFVPQDLGTLGGTVSMAYSVSDSGQVVGYAEGRVPGSRFPFFWQNGVMTDLDKLTSLPHGTVINSNTLMINNAGQIVGQENGAAGNVPVLLNPTGSSAATSLAAQPATTKTSAVPLFTQLDTTPPGSDNLDPFPQGPLGLVVLQRSRASSPRAPPSTGGVIQAGDVPTPAVSASTSRIFWPSSERAAP